MIGRTQGVVATLTVMGLVVALPARAQSARAFFEDGRLAFGFADYDRAANLLILGLNPAGAERDSLWGAGVHMLADALLAIGDTGNARVWTRWAVRLEPTLQVDTVNFAGLVPELFVLARRELAAEPGWDRRVAEVAWQWPATNVRQSAGALLLQGRDGDINGRIEGGGFIVSGAPQTLAPGTYSLLATAEGFLPARVRFEVLPGATTVLSFRLQPAQAGYLHVASRPWGLLLVDGERVGHTPIAALRLAVGAHRVRIERSGFLPFDTTVTLQQDQSLRLGMIQLRPGGR